MRLTRSVVTFATCLGAFLVLLPLGLEKPGLPLHLRANEPTELGLALSLSLDGDARCEAIDLTRIYHQFPYSAALRLHLTDIETPDAGAPAFHGDPLFAWVAALPARAAGANGMLALNALCLLGIFLTAGRRRGETGDADAGPGWVFNAVFLLAGSVFLYTYWLGPTVFHAFLVSLSLYLRLRLPVDGRGAHGGDYRAMASGATLGAAAAAHPWLLILAPAILAQRRALVAAGGLVVGVGLSIAAALGAGMAPLPALETAHVFDVKDPYDLPWMREEPKEVTPPVLGELADSPLRAAFHTVFFTLFEQRSGLFPYLPATLPLLLWLGVALWRRRFPWRNLPTFELLLAAGLLLGVMAQPWVKGSEVGAAALGNPAWVVLAPAILFLVPATPPAWVTLVATGLGVLTLGPALVSTLGGAMAYGGAQGHTRGPLMSRLPLDPAHVQAADGYLLMPLSAGSLDAELWIPKHLGQIQGDEAWMMGNTRGRLWLTTAEPIHEPVSFAVRTLASNNRITVTLDGDQQVLNFPDVPRTGSTTRIVFSPPAGQKRRVLDDGRDRWLYPLDVSSEWGRKPIWNRTAPVNFYLGVALAFLGPESFLEQDVYGARFEECAVPDRVYADEDIRAVARVTNTSAHPWPVTGAVKVRLGYRWLASDGTTVAEGPRTDFHPDPPAPVPPQATEMVWMHVEAPPQPGLYELELEPIYENISWFSEHGVETCRRPVEVTPALADAP